MKNQFMLLSCVLGLLLIPARAEEEKDSDQNALGSQMETMNDAFKAFRRETDAVKGASQARDAQTSALKAAAEIPERVKEMPDGLEKSKALVSYRKMTGKLYVTFCEVEEAFLDGKIEEVVKIVDAIKELKKSGHDKFMKDDE
jgi:soluble cytochrome b562